MMFLCVCVIAIICLIFAVIDLRKDVGNLRNSFVELLHQLNMTEDDVNNRVVGNVSDSSNVKMVEEIPIVKGNRKKKSDDIASEVWSEPISVKQERVYQKTKKTKVVKEEVGNSEFNIISRFNFGGKSPIVWFAGFAAILGAFYLVRYLVAHGFLNPAVRLTLLALGGGLSVIFGAKLYNKKDFADHERIGQVLISAGVTALYFVTYALSKLYFFAPEWVSFVLMCAVSVGAVWLTLKFGGRPIAILSMIGGFLTPLLVNNVYFNLAFFSGYILVFVAVFLYMSVVLASPLLMVLALLGGYIWAFSRLFCFDFYAYDSVLFMILVGGMCAMILKSCRYFDRDDVKGLDIFSLALCGVMAVLCLIKAHFGVLEWSICGLMLGALAILTLFDDKQYLPILAISAIVLLSIMAISMVGNRQDLFILVGIGLVCLAPIYYSLLMRFPHVLFSLYIGIMQILFFATAYIVFGKGWSLALYGIVGGMLCLLPVFSKKLKTKKDKNSGGILFLSFLAMVTFGLAVLFDRTDVFVIIAATEILVLSAASHLRISYVKEGLLCLVVWYGLMMVKAFTYVILLLFPIGWEGVKFYQPDLNTTAFVCYWVIPLICFMGSFLTVKDKEIKKIVLILTSAVGCAGLFMVSLAIKMFMSGKSIYQIDIYDYTLITVILLLSIFALKNKLSNIIPGIYFLAIARLVVMSTIIFDDFFNFGAFSYNGVMFIFGVPLVLMIVLAYCKINVCRLFVMDKLICSVILLTALVNVRLFHTPWFGDLASLGGGAVFIYSVAWFVLGVIWMILAFYYKELIKPAFGIIYFVIAKVFLYDVANLNDFWRIVALFALAGSLLSVSHFYTKNFKQERLS